MDLALALCLVAAVIFLVDFWNAAPARPLTALGLALFALGLGVYFGILWDTGAKTLIF